MGSVFRIVYLRCFSCPISGHFTATTTYAAENIKELVINTLLSTFVSVFK